MLLQILIIVDKSFGMVYNDARAHLKRWRSILLPETGVHIMDSIVTWDQMIQLGILLIAAASFLHTIIHNKRK